MTKEDLECLQQMVNLNATVSVTCLEEYSMTTTDPSREEIGNLHSHHEIHEGNCVTCQDMEAKVSILQKEIEFRDGSKENALVQIAQAKEELTRVLERTTLEACKLQAENKRLREALVDYEWLISELEMFKRRPEFTAALERIKKALEETQEALKSEGEG